MFDVTDVSKGRFDNTNHGGCPFPWSNFFSKIKIRKPLGPSVGVNQMWTQRNDHASNSDCVDFCNICPKKVLLKEKRKKEKTKFDHSLVFSCLHLLFPPKK